VFDGAFDASDSVAQVAKTAPVGRILGQARRPALCLLWNVRLLTTFLTVWSPVPSRGELSKSQPAASRTNLPRARILTRER
jgi:hypothetical protein